MEKCTAVLMEISSIQNYIFRSNKLREIVGASYLVDEVFNSLLKNILKSMGLLRTDFQQWKEDPDSIKICDKSINFEIGYIGGGNALLFFRKEDKAKEFIGKWTKKLLVDAPGMIPVTAHNQFDLDAFEESRNAIFKLLQKNKNRFIPRTLITRHGITAECPRSGYSMEIWNEGLPDENKGYVSSSINAKLEASKRSLHEYNKGEFSSILNNKFCFTNKLDSLGQRLNEKQNYISIVHIDGNEMGARFQRLESLQETRKLSVFLRRATKNAFKKMILELIKNFDKIQYELGFVTPQEKKEYPRENGKIVLPIRPIIIGGDDITFVSHGKLGIYLSQLFMNHFENEPIWGDQNVSTCGGVFISKTKYPFHYGYQRAEELCSNAKKIRHDLKDPGSWVDFHISYGGISGNIEDVRRIQYEAPEGDLLLRPYKIDQSSDRSLNLILKMCHEMKLNIPRSKIFSLRKLLYAEKSSIDSFVRDLKAGGTELPKFNNHNYHELIWENERTPYFDMIELMEFYPFSVMEE
ncbi:MAG: Cas10/Cmr2 second palm domain-containing protein [Elusimicrobiota bacterium]